MLAFRSASKATIALVRSFSTNSRPTLRAAASGGRPRAGSDTTVTGEPASRSRHGEPKQSRPPWRVQIAQTSCQPAFALIALPFSSASTSRLLPFPCASWPQAIDRSKVRRLASVTAPLRSLTLMALAQQLAPLS
jgi:hypothetical protein